MEIEYKEGDIFKGDEGIIVHGCNAQGVMGSGIAKIVKEKYTYAYDVYRKVYEKDGLELGNVYFAYPPNMMVMGDPIIINAITQFNYGRDPNVRYVSYDAVRKVVKALNHYSRTYISEWKDVHKEEPLQMKIAFPMIGAGLGNGDWNIISQIIEEEAVDFKPVVYKYNDNGEIKNDD